ncbi:hypothetical protein, partial [Cellulomonas septica]
EDADGARAAVPVGTVTLDGTTTTTPVDVPADGRVVAVDARLSAVGRDPDRQQSPRFTLEVLMERRDSGQLDETVMRRMMRELDLEDESLSSSWLERVRD